MSISSDATVQSHNSSADGQSTSNVPVVRAAVHWRAIPPFLPELNPVHERAIILGRTVGKQLKQAIEESGCIPEVAIISGTILASSLSDEADTLASFYREIQDIAGICPSGVATAYQCAGWGYTLRFFAQFTTVRRLAILLVDIDLHNFEAALNHPVIGASGFGVTTLLFDIRPGSDVFACGGPYRNSAYNELITELKRKQKLIGTIPTFIPFMRKEYAVTPERVLAKGSLGPNLNDELGHCFGADPWIGIIRNFAGKPYSTDVLVGSVGFKGYFTVAQVAILPDSVLRIDTIELGSIGNDSLPQKLKSELRRSRFSGNIN